MDYLETVNHWFEIQQAIKILQAEERALREGLFSGTFPKPKEGTNTVVLPDGRKLKGTHVINRKFLQEVWLKGGLYKTIGLPKEVKEKLIVVKYDFDLTTYRKLDHDMMKKFDQVLEIKPGLPKLELVPAKDE